MGIAAAITMPGDLATRRARVRSGRAQLAGAARLVDATAREQRRYTADLTAISERLIGFA